MLESESLCLECKVVKIELFDKCAKEWKMKSIVNAIEVGGVNLFNTNLWSWVGGRKDIALSKWNVPLQFCSLMISFFQFFVLEI